MPKPIDIDQLLANNPGVNAEQLRERLEASRKLRGVEGGRYKYNLLPPFSRRLRRQPAAEIGGPSDNIKKPL